MRLAGARRATGAWRHRAHARCGRHYRFRAQRRGLDYGGERRARRGAARRRLFPFSPVRARAGRGLERRGAHLQRCRLIRTFPDAADAPVIPPPPHTCLAPGSFLYRQEAIMKAKSDSNSARDAILSADEADAALAAWTLEDLEAEEFDARWMASDEPGG